MDCDVAREALSARIDGEREPVPTARVDEHLASCVDCRDWYARAVEQTQQLRRLAGRAQVSSVPQPRDEPSAKIRLRARATATWQRWALGVVGVVQIALAGAQGFGADVGIPSRGHLLNESTAWSAALGVVMVVAALRPAASSGLAAVLVVFTVVLSGFVINDATEGAVTVLRLMSHLPVLAGTVLALLVWRATRAPEPWPWSDAAPFSDDVVLPEHATRGRRRGHLHPTDGSAA
ncbi:putative transmembrane transcriptional regulator (anti-sigma factor) [Mycobacterium basiliense]|uniref:Putative transmembrane transcriptional regulator (Anti-sigma factor) n=1 Tax=Mycobacterium basiliense TaxID=2094119 RepID=A0A3S4DTD2_9MYCO|nr:zf-HC2 domain-containing protein [Mycobacterium basiliense]VDM88806.1 putative transmembrane transcriptional regulator (anti-sigma factor) [Mycobacterium basiliense]